MPRGLASTATMIDERLSPGNVTVVSGEAAMLACKIYNLGNKSVSDILVLIFILILATLSLVIKLG